MPKGRIDALDAMGFTWQSEKRKDAWSRYFDELVEYMKVSFGLLLCCIPLLCWC
jgi:hypothetical protein